MFDWKVQISQALWLAAHQRPGSLTAQDTFNNIWNMRCLASWLACKAPAEAPACPEDLCDLEAWHNLDPKAQETTTRALKELVREPIPSPKPSYTSGDLDLDDYLNDLRTSPERDAGVDDQTAYGPFKEADVSEVLTEYSNVTVRPSSESTSGYKSDPDDNNAVIIPKSTDIPVAASDAAHTFLERLSLEDTEPARIEEAYEVSM